MTWSHEACNTITSAPDLIKNQLIIKDFTPDHHEATESPENGNSFWSLPYANVFSVEDRFDERKDSDVTVFFIFHSLKISKTFFRKFFPTIT